MSIIKDADLKMAKLQIQDAITNIELLEEDKNIHLEYIINHLNEALSHLNV